MKTLIAVLALSVSVSAQSSLSTRLPYMVLIAGETADTWTTVRALNQGGIERNPLLSQHPAAIVVQKTLWTVALVSLMKLSLDRGHPTLAKTIGYLDGAGGFAAAWHNHVVN